MSALLVFQHWLAKTGRLPAQYLFLGAHSYYVNKGSVVHGFSNLKTFMAARIAAHSLMLAKNTFVALLYIGLFLSPVLIFAVTDAFRSHKKQVIFILAATVGTMAVVCGVVAQRGIHPAVTAAEHYGDVYLMPLSGNVLMNSGIGPITLPDSWRGADYAPALPSLPTPFWFCVTLVSVCGAGCAVAVVSVLAVRVVSKVRRGNVTDDEVAGIFLLLSGLIYLVPLLVLSFMDRYLISLIPLVVVGIACLRDDPPGGEVVGGKPLRLLAISVLVSFSLFAIGGTRDYQTWNQLRWDAVQDLVGSGTAHLEDINGGLEVNGWYMYDPNYQYAPDKSWWWVRGDSYRISFGNMPGYRILKEYRYYRLIPPRAERVLTLQKNP